MDERGWTMENAMDERIPEETASSLFIVVDRAGSVASIAQKYSFVYKRMCCARQHKAHNMLCTEHKPRILLYV
jgi:hypothetical protein